LVPAFIVDEDMQSIPRIGAQLCYVLL